MEIQYKFFQKQSCLLYKGLADLETQDPELAHILDAEVNRQNKTLSLGASCCAVAPKTLVSSASVLSNVTAEGSPGRRYHAGCENVDLVESLAIARARDLFNAQYVNVQPHSASNANYQVLSALLRPGDTLLGMDLDHGGHLTHGSLVTFSGKYYRAIGYGTTQEGIIDYDQVRKLAHTYCPKMIICGATAYSRVIDFPRFRKIADEIGAILLADISHIAGLVVTNRHLSSIDAAHVTTTCTHKQLSGPRGGLILSGRDAHENVPGKNITFTRALQKAVFPWMQGAPIVNMIAAKATAFLYAASSEFDSYMRQIRITADTLVSEFHKKGYDIIGGYTENHTILIRLHDPMTGSIAESVLEQCSIIVNKNRVPGEKRSSFITSGLRIGTGSLAQRQFDKSGCRQVVELICCALNNVTPIGDKDFILDPSIRKKIRSNVEHLCAAYPIRDYVRIEENKKYKNG
jgi:glycine hydroxymethyltransferase